jgi:hypothetical protein
MITFIGAKETGTDTLTWGPDITLQAGKAVLIDTDEAKTSEARVLAEHLLSVEENGDTEIPPDWREMHHKRLIALAKRLGGSGDDLATRDGAIAYIDEYLALGGGTTVPKPSEKA